MPNQPDPEIFRTTYREFNDTLEALTKVAKLTRTTLSDVQRNALGDYVELWEAGKITKDDIYAFSDVYDDAANLSVPLTLRFWHEDYAAMLKIAKKCDARVNSLYRVATALYTQKLLAKFAGKSAAKKK